MLHAFWNLIFNAVFLCNKVCMNNNQRLMIMGYAANMVDYYLYSLHSVVGSQLCQQNVKKSTISGERFARVLLHINC
jgi:hypothetical protein